MKGWDGIACDRCRNEGRPWASGAWFIGPDGRTLAQVPSSTQRSDSKEFVLIYNVPITGR
jgi:hypothetical protein